MGSDWPTIRKRKLERDPWCANVYGEHGYRTRATTVDHILARAFGGTNDPSNLMSLCQPCADRKNHEDRERGKRR
jgi:5-methylcytosine-specific restriction enzyme A